MGYSKKYYKRHLDQYRDWENAIGDSIYNSLLPESMLDLGCGVGSYLEGAKLAGCKKILGIEINFDMAKPYIVDIISSSIIKDDITKSLNLDGGFDCVVSFEAAEHIEPDGTLNFVYNLTHYAKKYIVFTAAPPGQSGTGHINLMEREKWIKIVEQRGFEHQRHMVEKFKLEWEKFKPGKYILNNLMVFKKIEERRMNNKGLEDNTYVKLQNTELRSEFLKFSEEQLTDYKFLATFIRDKVGVSLNRENLKKTGVMPIEEYDKMKCWYGLGSKQYPDELAKFLVFIYNHRSEIKSYCEIGCASGGTFFVVDSFLRAINEDMGDSFAIDTNNKCAKDFITYIYQNPKAKFLNISSTDFEPEMVFDLCFIDANHSFNASKADYEKMKEFSKYLSFHDIYLLSGGVKDLWKTIEGNKTEFLNEDTDFPDPVGIGVILSEDANL